MFEEEQVVDTIQNMLRAWIVSLPLLGYLLSIIDHNILLIKLPYYGIMAQPCSCSKVTYRIENEILKLNK